MNYIYNEINYDDNKIKNICTYFYSKVLIIRYILLIKIIL